MRVDSFPYYVVLLITLSRSWQLSLAEHEHYGDCGDSLTETYLSGLLENEEVFNFVPSVYYMNSSTKLISTRGDSFDHYLVCVDGARTSDGPIQLYDDGTHGDDFAGDGVYSRGCVHYCLDCVNLDDFFGYAMMDTIGSQSRLVVMDPAIKGTVPYETLDTPLTPGASVIASSHAFFFSDVNRKYYPKYPASTDPNDFAAPSGRSVIISALLQVFGDVFDFVTYTPIDNGRYDGGIYKWQFWDRRGGPSDEWQGFGEVNDEGGECIIALNGLPPYRLAGVIGNSDVVESFTGTQNHELAHGTSGFEYHNKFGPARSGDGAHYDSPCTGDHSSLQGPVWDWVKGYPESIPPEGEGHISGTRLVENADCSSCPDGKLTECCSFRYVDIPYTRASFIANPELNGLSPLLLYIAGMIKRSDIPPDERNYYCIGSDKNDLFCGTGEDQTPCVTKVDDSDRSSITADFVSRFTLDDLISANGGIRYPTKKFNTIRHAAIHVSSRVPSASEIEFYTLLWRHHEVATQPWERKPPKCDDSQDPAWWKEAIQPWNHHTQGKSVLHSRLHGIDCGTDNLSVPSCGNGQGDVCADAPCGDGAICTNLDGKPLCMCREGLVGDGIECAYPEETSSYKNQKTAYEISSSCFPEDNQWTSFTSESDLPPYPGGTAPYSPNSCGSKVCAPGWGCVKNKCKSPTSKSMCDSRFRKSQCKAMGCCKFKNGMCKKRGSGPGVCSLQKNPSAKVCKNEGNCKFLYKIDEEENMIVKKCKWLAKKTDAKIAKVCNGNKNNIAKLGYKPAREVCNASCG